MLDVFFLSYNEPFAHDNYQILLEKAPHAKRINGVTGFFQAHRACAEASMTHNFYVVDADAIIVDDFDFSFRPSSYNTIWNKPESDIMFVWSSRNPINDLSYGYGGVKLIPKLPIIKHTGSVDIDFTTSVGLSLITKEQVSNITAFNYDPFHTWRAAVRECTKLALNLTNRHLESQLKYDIVKIEQALAVTNERLHAWATIGADRPYGEYALLGAKYAIEFANNNKDNNKELSLINNIEWMKNEFTKFF